MSAFDSSLAADERALKRLEIAIAKKEALADRISESIIIEIGAEAEFKYELKLEKIKAELARLYQQRAEILTRAPRERLRDALFSLDFKDQLHAYRKLTMEKRPSAFLVLPEPPEQSDHIGIAAGLLVNRLLRVLPDYQSTKPLKMSFRRRVKRSDSDALWRELANVAELPWPADQQVVIDAVLERLKTQSVVILITDLDRVDLGDCIDQFWVHLASAATEAQVPYSLVLLLVNWDGDTEADARDTPVPLPIRSLSYEDILCWLRALEDHCPLELLNAAEDAAREIIAAASERNPDGVLSAICSRPEWNCPEFPLEQVFTI
jgi:hypothetical protein